MLTAIAAAVLAAFGFLLHSDDSHHFNIEYRMWKLGWVDYDPKFIRFLNVDAALRASLIGDDVDSVKRYFPDLRAKEEPNDYQKYYSSRIEYDDYFWIGDSAWTVEFRDDKVVEFHLVKG